MKQSKIVEIPEKMRRYYGEGTMLHPDVSLIEEEIRSIPRGKVSTIELLCKKMALDYGTNVTCPMRTGNGVKKLAEKKGHVVENDETPYWRLIRTDHLVVKSKQYELAAARLEEEGFELEYLDSGNIKVKVGEGQLFSP